MWDAEIIKIYCDGKCYFKCTYGEWYSGSDRGNAYAPFDQRFYLILNLAAGGTFDSGYVPDDSFTSGLMKVDYVRVYQKILRDTEDEKPDKNKGVTTDGAHDHLYGDYKLGIKTPENPTTKPAVENPTTKNAVEVPTNNGNKKPNSLKKALAKTKITKAVKKKKAAKLSLKFKKVKGAKKYKVQIASNKKFKKVLLKKTVKKVTVVIKSRKLKGKKKLYVRVMAVGAKKWSKVKKVKIK